MSKSTRRRKPVDPLGPPPQLSVHFRQSDPLSLKDRSDWLEAHAQRVANRSHAKVTLGMLEHGGDIGVQSITYLLDQLEDEAIDTLAYIAELKRRIKDRKNF